MPTYACNARCCRLSVWDRPAHQPSACPHGLSPTPTSLRLGRASDRNPKLVLRFPICSCPPPAPRILSPRSLPASRLLPIRPGRAGPACGPACHFRARAAAPAQEPGCQGGAPPPRRAQQAAPRLGSGVGGLEDSTGPHPGNGLKRGEVRVAAVTVMAMSSGSMLACGVHSRPWREIGPADCDRFWRVGVGNGRIPLLTSVQSC